MGRGPAQPTAPAGRSNGGPAHPRVAARPARPGLRSALVRAAAAGLCGAARNRPAAQAAGPPRPHSPPAEGGRPGRSSAARFPAYPGAWLRSIRAFGSLTTSLRDYYIALVRRVETDVRQPYSPIVHSASVVRSFTN